MPLVIPQLDDSTYSEILREAMVRIPVHNPEWTNFNDSDPGITLLQLFSFMTENLLYRANLIPERNRLKFLTLLGMTLTPASAAHGVVTIANERGPLQTVTLQSNLPMTAGQIGFVTQNGLDILPVEMQAFYRQPLSAADQQSAQQTYGLLYSTFTTVPSQLAFYETVPFTAPASAASIPSVSLTNGTDTVDGSLWLALVARTGETAQIADVLNEIAGSTVTLGIMPQIEDASRNLYPGGTATAQGQPVLQYAISTGTLVNNAPVYQTLESSEDDNPLQDLTLVQLTIPSSNIGVWTQLQPLDDGTGDYPPTMNDPTVAGRLLAWIRIRLTPNADGSVPSTVTANFSWVGINATRVTQQIQVVAEPLSAGTGEPDQTGQLSNTPVITSSVQLAVNGVLWTQIDDLLAAPPEVPVRDPSLPPGVTMPASKYPSPQVFTVDGESGQIQFGDGLHGARPAAGTSMVASYAYGGGAVGNVGIAAIQSSPQLPAGFTVENPLPTWGGDDGETLSEAEQNIPDYLQNGGRAVSSSDFSNIVNQTPGVALGRVEILPLFNPDQVDVSAPGSVTVMVIPKGPGAPEPDLMFLDAVCNYLEPRRLVTTEVYVRGPAYVGFYVSIGVDVIAGQDIATVTQAVRTAVRQYLSPLCGGPSKNGWPLSKTVDPTGLMVQALLVAGVSDVNQVLLWDETMSSIPKLSISGLQLPDLLQITVSSGTAPDLSAAVTTTTAAPPTFVIPAPQTTC
ncbi:putative phage baseplate assembly protein [Edaphobacter aggregans]|uniref:Putative phage baseplate assembly protein n=1 Tax=Edaphobacter aggregans TaxID=570835 RepID=A0A3R9NVU4_9BACT|nr:baseplate J/gp47 family protein [Edaphobacter aggregans]RSL17989.1 putative phage baseplate assembly protein [Edaphobacter aggregans]